jgi:hypothetical protein
MGASALLLTDDINVQSVISPILAELGIETEVFTDVSLAALELGRVRFVALVLDCDIPGAERLLTLGHSPSNRGAISFLISIPGEANGLPKANFALSKPLQMRSARLTMRAASGLMLSLYRRNFRCELAVPISISNGKREFHAQTTNMSMGGLAIKTREVLTKEEQFRIELALPNGFKFQSDAKVVWADRLGHAALFLTSTHNSSKLGLQDWIDTKIQKTRSRDGNEKPSFQAPSISIRG